MGDDHLARLCFAFVDEIEAATDLADLSNRFDRALKAFGIDTYAVGAVDLPLGSRPPQFYVNEWPQEWLRAYVELDFVSADPIVINALRSPYPVVLSELMRSRPLPQKARQLYDVMTTDFPWRDAMAVPIHGLGDEVGIVGLAAEQLDLSRHQRLALHILAIQTFQKARQLAGKERPAVPVKEWEGLSDRERECLRWVAEGKSDAEIADVIGTSPRTAHFHVERAKKKLGAGTRAQAVARAIRLGLLWT